MAEHVVSAKGDNRIFWMHGGLDRVIVVGSPRRVNRSDGPMNVSRRTQVDIVARHVPHAFASGRRDRASTARYSMSPPQASYRDISQAKGSLGPEPATERSRNPTSKIATYRSNSKLYIAHFLVPM